MRLVDSLESSAQKQTANDQKPLRQVRREAVDFSRPVRRAIADGTAKSSNWEKQSFLFHIFLHTLCTCVAKKRDREENAEELYCLDYENPYKNKF